jgi:hypothetical protein
VDTQEQAGRPDPQLTLRRQRGWIGLIALLLALVIVAVLAQTALKRYGLLRSDATANAPNQVDPATTTPRNALERARGVEAAVRQQAEDLSKKIDDAAK